MEAARGESSMMNVFHPSLRVQAEDRTQAFALLPVPSFSMMSLSAAIEPLRSLNRLSARQAYSWRLVSPEGGEVEASNGIAVKTVSYGEALEGADHLLVCGGPPVDASYERAYLKVLRYAAHKGIPLGSLSTGTYLLARAGLLDGYRCTIHWENRTAFQEDFPDIECTNNLYEIDRDRMTCSGGTAAMDLMLHLIAARHGEELACAVANQFHHERIRGDGAEQRGGRMEFVERMPERLRTAVGIMRSNIEDPVPLPAIAQRSGTSSRQLERLFMRHTGLTPHRYYMQMRLERARELLIYSDRPIIDIAVQTGFASTSYFATCYRRVFGVKPSEARVRSTLQG
ncbi:GlxA family transcriptional regulator [Chelativorans xinjiangense]|uniref:GlxA family transcriptional regulator n=1 Tax=Chelativorans xinjiangense TaxID=2681485 RepID=UPI001FEC9124|nr:GlxA family transcriptional regulator [Chelativorans xinjiangense]